MNRNTNSRFALNPSINIQRTKMAVDPEVKSSFNLGRLYPLGMPWEVLPGDTWNVNTSAAVRMQPLVSAPMDNLHMDVYFFYCPSRLLWTHWREFMGENTNGHWIPQTEYTVPQTIFPMFPHSKSIADYMGLPIYDSDPGMPNNTKLSVSSLRFRGYCLIWNEWFRDENLQDPVYVDLGDTNTKPVQGPAQVTGNLLNSTFDQYSETYMKQFAQTGAIYPLPVAKTHDYFTSALPGPQRSADSTVLQTAQVYFGDLTGTGDLGYEMIEKHGANDSQMVYLNPGTTQNPFTATWYDNGTAIPSDSLQPMNWFTDVSFTVNELRMAFQIQRFYERLARSGSRYTELLRGMFGVQPADASLQRPQYLGGFRKSVQTNQVLQTSETSNTPQGNVAGYSLTGVGREGSWIHSFDEHGYIFPLVCFRRDEPVYQQGVNKSWLRKSKFDYFFPTLANISEQPIENIEIYAQGYIDSGFNVDPGTGVDHEVFGYQEPWADYRYIPSIVTAEMHSALQTSLDSWHYADDYNELPHLSDSWIRENPSYVDRALAVSHDVSDQFFGDFKFHIEYTRPMPMYSVPGLIDHN